jgi:hypothetical protein
MNSSPSPLYEGYSGSALRRMLAGPSAIEIIAGAFSADEEQLTGTSNLQAESIVRECECELDKSEDLRKLTKL